ncbi:MAG: MBL fold metallo-hydrolase [Candidatus Altiarchaeota archaeon]|nr:MBL fold metallo-hydrolase [Candidatus Altiarchaeota archaeon]
MKVTPVAFESLGVRSMATLVEAGERKFFIDPSAALGPSRYGLPPAREELSALEESKKRIHDLAAGSDVLVITHYHYDHHDPDEDFYGGKIVLAKDIEGNINYSQKGRGRYFKEQVGGVCDLQYADGREFEFNNVKVAFSKPFPHGPEGSRLGFVLMCAIDDGKERLVFSSDVQGPVSDESRDWIIEAKPDLLVMDGPPTYFLGYKFSVENMEKAKENTLKIINETGCELILEHHILRDLKYKERFAEVYDTGNAKTAAEYLGVENKLLEMHRKELWGTEKPNYSMMPLQKGVKYD